MTPNIDKPILKVNRNIYLFPYNNSDMTLGQRLRDARKEAGLSQKELAQRVGMKQATISDLENDKTKGSTEIAAMAHELRVRALWLAEGRGPRNLSNGVANVVPAEMGLRRVPLISNVQAGKMTETTDPFPVGGAFEYLSTDAKVSDEAFALEIDGHSMEPEFKPGDRIIVDPAISPRPGDFVVAKNGKEEATFKKYRPRGTNESGREVFELVPLNDDYPTLYSDREPVRVIGVMIEHRRYRRR